jgi:putative ABC transport system permease protein
VIWTLDPWRRAPFLLWRRRPVAIVLAAAAGVLSAAAAAGPLFVSSAANETFRQQLTKQCQPGGALHADGFDLFSGNSSGADPIAAQLFDIHGTTRTATVGAVPHVLPPLRELSSAHVRVIAPGAAAGASEVYVTVMSKTGSLAHVDRVNSPLPARTDPAPDDVWLADTAADGLHVRTGDTVDFAAADPALPLVPLRVGGVFKDLNREATPPFWCNDETLIHTEGNSPVFPFALVDTATAAKVASDIHLDLADHTLWPVDLHAFNVEDAPALVRRLDQLSREVPAAVNAARDTALQTYLTGHPAQDPGFLGFRSRDTAATTFHLPAERARFVASILPSTVTPITLAAVVVALLLVGGSGSFWFERRKREVDVLLAHGVGPIALGAKAILESVLPFGVGGVAGWFASSALVRAVGPSSLLSSRSQLEGVLFAAIAVAAGFGCIGVVASLRCRQRERASFVRPTTISRVPWELFVLAGAAVGAVVLSAASGGATSIGGGAVARVDPVVLVAPLLGFVAASAAAARLMMFVLRRARRGGDRLGNSSWLAWRRLTGIPGAAALLMAAVALPTAVGVYGATVNASVHRTLNDQNRMLIGADVVVDLPQREKVPAALKNRASLVLRRDHPTFGGDPFSVIGVDPAAFAKTAFWDGAMPAPSMPSLVRKLHDDGPGAPIEAVLSGSAANGSTLDMVDPKGDVHVSVNVIASATNLPGKQGGYPALFVDRAALERLSTAGTYQFWIHGDVTSALGALAAAGIAPTFVRTADSVTDGSYVQPVAYTFSFLNALVTLIGAVAGGALLLYLDARSRARRVGYVLARRMGLSRLAHLASIAIELGVAMLAGLAAGVAFSVGATALLSSRFSVDPQIPPHTVLSYPWRAAAIDAGVLLVVIVVATIAAQFASERTPAAEVLREA